MHSFLILALSFASMCSFLSWATLQPAQQSISFASVSKVIRVHHKAPAPEVVTAPLQTHPARVTARQAAPAPLDLSIPTLQAIGISSELSVDNSGINWFEKNQEHKVHYEAQLLFDEEEGTSIRGGQINITIPMG
jgi:hypothetical protein